MPTLPENTFGTYVYYLNKYADLVETPVFVLRRKQQQVSFLHVYHHIMVVSCGYLLMCVQPGKHICQVLRSEFYHFRVFKYAILVKVATSGSTA